MTTSDSTRPPPPRGALAAALVPDNARCTRGCGSSTTGSTRGRWCQILQRVNEADTCRKFVVPKLQAAGWDTDPHSIAEQRTITDGRIVPVGKGFVRKPPKRVDYLLRYTRDFPLAVVEAKAACKTAGDGLQQAKQYAEMLGLKFAYATNGHEIIEFDYFTGLETLVTAYPTPAELWAALSGRQRPHRPAVADRLLTPFNHDGRQGRALLPADRHQPHRRGAFSRASGGCS